MVEVVEHFACFFWGYVAVFKLLAYVVGFGVYVHSRVYSCVYIRLSLSRALCTSNCIILFGLNAALLRVALFEQNIGSSHGRAYLRRYSVALSGVLRHSWRTILFRRSLFYL